MTGDPTPPPASIIEELRGLYDAQIAAGKALDRGPRFGEIRDSLVATYHSATLELQRAAINALPQLLSDRARMAEMEGAYQELLFAVSMKHPGETRHETALRYIRSVENRGSGADRMAAKQERAALTTATRGEEG